MPQYNLTLVTPPANEPISLTQAKRWARVVITDDDPDISDLITAARVYVENYTGRQLCNATWMMQKDSFYNLIYSSGADPRLLYGRPIPEVQGATGTLPFAGAIRLPRPPLQSITLIQYIDTQGNTQTLATNQYIVDTANVPARLTPSYGNVWPVTREIMNAVQITFVAGYSADGTSVPRDLQAVIKATVAAAYNYRESIDTAVHRLSDYWLNLLDMYDIKEMM